MGAPLALGEQATTVYVDPHEVRNPVRAARVAAHVLGLKANDVYRAITVKPTHFSYVARKADPVKAARLANGSSSGFHFYGEERRTYPQHTVAAPVLGFAGVDNDGPLGPRAAARTASSPAAPASRRSSRIRSAARSASRTPSPRSRARRCSSRSTTRSRRTRSRCCARRSRSGVRSTRRRSCSIRRRAASSRWPRRRRTTRTRPRRRACRRTTRSPTSSSRARCSRS